jgi:GT2 family glycosyltransferase
MSGDSATRLDGRSTKAVAGRRPGASDAAARPALSVIVPVRNDPENLDRCLAALDAARGPADEIIVVDDASTDSTVEVARRHDVRLLRQEDRTGPAAARNRGAEAAEKEYLFFLDADVTVRPDTLDVVVCRFMEEPRVDAFFGSYDAAPAAPGLVSQYRNLLHHHVHQTGNQDAFTFWSGCGAIRRSVFLGVGGFDAGYESASIEDIELGGRLRRAGHRIELLKSLQVKHLKRWTLGRMIECDIRKRGIPWTLLVLRQRAIPNDLNLRHGQRVSALLAAGAVAAPVLAALDGERIGLWILVTIACLAGVVGLNRGLFLRLVRVKGVPFAAASLPLHIVYYLSSGIAFAAGTVLHLTGRRAGRRSETP